MITDTIKSFWLSGRKTKTTPSGWISGNAPCCHHRGQSVDKRGRGGLHVNENNGISYACFNCGFKASWHPGKHLSRNMKLFLEWLGVDETTIAKLNFETLKISSDTNYIEQSLIPTFHTEKLPANAEPIINFKDNVPVDMLPVLQYMTNRNLYLEDYNFHWSPLHANRLIIPFYYKNTIVGYTARSVDNTKPKYLTSSQPGYVFNLDNQSFDKKFVLVCEGPIDALGIHGCALLGANINPQQNLLLKQLNREIILIPDKDKTGQDTVMQALNYGWSVSMPDFPEGVKDINDCILKLGRLATLWLIINAKESYKLKILLKQKQWFKE